MNKFASSFHYPHLSALLLSNIIDPTHGLKFLIPYLSNIQLLTLFCSSYIENPGYEQITYTSSDGNELF